MQRVNIIYVVVAQQWFRSCRAYMPEIGYRDDKELIFFAILFLLNIVCDIIRDVINKRDYV